MSVKFPPIFGQEAHISRSLRTASKLARTVDLIIGQLRDHTEASGAYHELAAAYDIAPGVFVTLQQMRSNPSADAPEVSGIIKGPSRRQRTGVRQMAAPQATLAQTYPNIARAIADFVMRRAHPDQPIRRGVR